MRFLFILTCAAALASPAMAAGQADNWIELPVNQGGARGWYDVGTVHLQGQWRTVRMRWESTPGAQPSETWVRIDCVSGALQTIGGFNNNGEPIPAGDWSMPVPGSIGTIIKTGVCSR